MPSTRANPSASSPAVATRPSAQGAWWQVVAALLWLPQAAVIAWGIEAIHQQAAWSTLAKACALFLALGLLRALIDGYGIRRAFAAARAHTQQLRLLALQALAQHSPLHPQRPSAGLAASVLNEQADHITPYFARYTTARTKVMVVPLVILVCVFSFSWVAGLVLLVAAPLIPIFMALVGWRAEAASKKHLQDVGNLNQFLLDRLQGLASIRGLGAVSQVAQQLASTADQLRANTMAVLKIAFLSSAVLELFSALGVALVAVYVGFHLLGQIPFGSWGGTLGLAQAMFVLLLSPAFFEPLRELSAVWHDKAAGVAAEQALLALQQPGPQLVGAGDGHPDSAANANTAAALAIDGISFQYSADSPLVISALSATIEPGERVALWGESGSGKSTVMALIAGLAAPSAGSIHIDGQPMDAAHADCLRSGMAWVAQKPHVLAASLVDNIRLGRDIDDDALQQAVRSAALGPVLALRGNTVVGDGGLGLSGGEALRLTLARAAATPGCRLILADEPTAHLDAETAAFVRQGLLDLAARGATLVVATHDPLLAACMDRLLSLDGSQPTDRTSDANTVANSTIAAGSLA
ncbi:thiol reductant ABC exporter subunit CydD [Comamonas piscis]|uniref:Thiol reductant ABC exporter subunit CydD n=1 Tax=Comamonas piscis TaxID=1562974 RepID=A0A7G5EJA5_9BURK|nr:thiol reductant ABC exporter subunit CydD [Comamonas piscis]QMV74080.1 thiol reductant ABC exporter subunit CydD [Comamonas piscis]WSO32517.1 thiol reductant ABC exporter subunit CydD [Comamonas piscis]